MIATFGTALASALGDMVTGVTAQIGDIAPIALPVFAGLIGIEVLFKVGRKVTSV